MNNNEFIKFKNSIAFKCIFKILIYSIISFTIFKLIVDGLYNDVIADNISSVNRNLYLWCVQNKTVLFISSFFSIIIIVAFVIIRKSNNNIIKIMTSMDQILKEPEKEIKLSDDLLILENRLNKIRIDLITNKNKAQEETQKKNDLIMYMAHDLKTPLTSVIGYLTLLSEEKDISKSLQEKYLKIS